MKGFFGNLFDLNRDGKLNAFERTLDFMAFQDAISAAEKESGDTAPCFLEEADDSDEMEEKLEEAGIDSFDFEYRMDDDEKRAALEKAGLDPWDFDL